MKLLKIVVLVGGSMFVTAALAHALDVQTIVEKSNLAAYYQGNDGRAKVSMEITDGIGRKRTREFTILRRDKADEAEQKFYVYFHQPSDVRKTVFMVWKHPGQDDDRWLYLPALDLVRRIAASDERSSFVGSHFLYEDISGRGAQEDRHELLDENDEAYHLKSTPKDPVSVEFDYYETWIDKSNFIPTRAEYYDKQGKKYRIVEALEVQEIQGHPTVTRAKVTDLNSGGFTVSTFEQIEYDIGLTEDVFTERFLRRAPRKWLKGR
jgi:hypothetical protein